MPRTDEQAICADERFDPGAVGRAFFEIVLDGDGLSVERERPKVGIAPEDVQEARHHREEPRAVSLEPLVPLAVPMRVRDHEGTPAKAPAHERDDARRENAEDDADDDAAEHIEGVMDPDDDPRERGGYP